MSPTQPLKCCPALMGTWKQQANQCCLHAPKSKVPSWMGSQQSGCKHTFPFKTLVLCARA